MENWTVERRAGNLFLTGPTCARCGEEPVELKLPADLVDQVAGGAKNLLSTLTSFWPSSSGDDADGLDLVEALEGEEIPLGGNVVCDSCAQLDRSVVEDALDQLDLEVHAVLETAWQLREAHRAHDAGRVHALLEGLEDLAVLEAATSSDDEEDDRGN